MITATMSWLEALAIVLCLTGSVAFAWTLSEAVKDRRALSRLQLENGRGALASDVIRGEALLLCTMLVFLTIAVQGALRPEPIRPSTVLWENMIKAAIMAFIVSAVAHSLLSMRSRRRYLETHMMGADMDTGPLDAHHVAHDYEPSPELEDAAEKAMRAEREKWEQGHGEEEGA